MARRKTTNPFDKRFGRTPLVWAGRRDVLDLIDQSLRHDDRESMRQLLLHGPRGSGWRKCRTRACCFSSTKRTS